MPPRTIFNYFFVFAVAITLFANNAYAKQQTVRIKLQYSEKLGEETKEGKPKCKNGGLAGEVDCVAEHIDPSEASDKSEKLASASLILDLTPYLETLHDGTQIVRIRVDGGGPVIVGQMSGKSTRDIQNDTKLAKERLKEWRLSPSDTQKQELSENGNFAFTVERPFKELKKLILVNTPVTLQISNESNSCTADSEGMLPNSETEIESMSLDDFLHDQPMDIETGKGFPEWWTEKDTEKFLEELPKILEDELKDAATEEAIERAIERATRKLIARKLAEGEARIIRDRLIRCGKSPKTAEKIAKRLAQRLQKEYLYTRPDLLTRVTPLKQGIRSLRKLMKSPKSWVRFKIGKIFTKGLGKLGGRVFAVVGLVDDLYTIGQACWYGYQAAKAKEGAEEQLRQCEEMHQDLMDFRERLNSDQRRQIDDLYRREQIYFGRAHRNEMPIVEP
jgi:hypothetical protein